METQNKFVPYTRQQPVVLDPSFFPALRTVDAVMRGVNKNVLINCWGGIGDQVCSEPTIRHAIHNFKDCKITIATTLPELFQHLPYHDLYDLKKERPIHDDYWVCEPIPNQSPQNLAAQFISHMVMNCVDFPAVSAFRMQLPIKDREIVLKPKTPTNEVVLDIVKEAAKHVVVHPGRHWVSKTFPAAWYNRGLASIIKEGFIPVLIGKEDGPTQGTVNVDVSGCIDLREKTTLNDTIWLLQNTGVLICNDSSPLHMAASGKAWIGFFASVKHPDFITHWRNGQWSWRMQNLSVDGIYNHFNFCPNTETDLLLDNVEESLVLRCLPEPEIIGPWCKEKMDDYFRSI